MADPFTTLWDSTVGNLKYLWRQHRVVNRIIHADPKGVNRNSEQIGKVHGLIVNLTYSRTKTAKKGKPVQKLKTDTDVHEFEKLLANAGVDDVTVVTDKLTPGLGIYDRNAGHPTVDNVLQELHGIGQRCQPNDMFIFFFAGHAWRISTKGNTEEALALYRPKMTNDPREENLVGRDSMLYATKLFSAINSFFHEKVRVTMLLDCCHSAGLAGYAASNLVSPNRELVAIAACQPSEQAWESWQGGVFTCALIEAVERIDSMRDQRLHEHNMYTPSYTVAHVYNWMIKWMFKKGYSKGKGDVTRKQELSLIWSDGTQPDIFPWALSRHGYQITFNLGDAPVDYDISLTATSPQIQHPRQWQTFERNYLRQQ